MDCIYWPVLVKFNNQNIIQFNNKPTRSQDFDDIHKVFLGGISESGKYGSINASDTTTMGYYIVKYGYEIFTLKEDIINDGQVLNTIKLAVRSE